MLKRIAASVYIFKATPNARDQYFHEGILCEQRATDTVDFSLVDFFLVHWEEDGFEHYDPVFDLRTSKPWTASTRCLQTMQEIHQNSNLLKAFSSGDMDLIRKIALQILRRSSSSATNIDQAQSVRLSPNSLAFGAAVENFDVANYWAEQHELNRHFDVDAYWMEQEAVSYTHLTLPTKA